MRNEIGKRVLVVSNCLTPGFDIVGKKGVVKDAHDDAGVYEVEVDGDIYALFPGELKVIPHE
jgi:hypothetical protein